VTQQIVLGEGRVKIGLVTSAGRVGILLMPTEAAFAIGHRFEPRDSVTPNPGSVVIWGLNPEAVRVLQDAVNALETALERAKKA